MCLSVVKIANVKLLETRKWGERKVFIATNQINLEVSMVKKKKNNNNNQATKNNQSELQLLLILFPLQVEYTGAKDMFLNLEQPKYLRSIQYRTTQFLLVVCLLLIICERLPFSIILSCVIRRAINHIRRKCVSLSQLSCGI